MFASRLNVSEDTLKKNQLSKRQQGKLRYEKLVEYERSGEISFATTRNELAQMLGFGDGEKRGISWVNNMVNRGYISESLVGLEGGKMRKEFHLTNKKPDYDFTMVKETNKRLKAEAEAKKIAVEKKLEQEEQENNLTIKKGEMVITTRLDGRDIVNLLINILK